MKVTVIGGGGFRAPLIWKAVAGISEDVCVAEIVLHDIRESRLRSVSAVVEALRRERPGPPVRTTTSLADAVEDAGVVLCAIRVGGLEARVVDESVPLREGLLGQETVGPGGICFALRTIPVILEIARATRMRAPSAWFVNFTNPAGLVTEVLRTVLGDRVVGICDSPAALCGRVFEALGRPQGEVAWDYAGINHLGWLLGVRIDGQDLLPALIADDRLESIEEVRRFGVDDVRASGVIPNEYLIYYKRPVEIASAFAQARRTRAEILLEIEAQFFAGNRRDPETALRAWRRACEARFGSYMAEARGPSRPEAVPSPKEGSSQTGAKDAEREGMGYAGIAAAFLLASTKGTDETLILNVANRGSVRGLDEDAVVEVPCTVGSSGILACKTQRLPSDAARLVQRVKEVERLTIEAALRGSRKLALEALAAHPLVPSRDAAGRVLSGYLSSFPELESGLR